MNLRISARLIAAVSLIILQPLGHAQTKVFTPAELAQAQRDAAARAAAAAKKRAARAAAGQPGAPAAPAPGGPVYVSVTNNTQVTFRAIVAGPDGSPRVVGQIPPSAQSGGPTQLESFPGQEWGFANPEGQIIAGYAATSAPQQRYSIGAPGQQQNPGRPNPNAPAAGGGQNPQRIVRITVQNRWGDTVFAKPRNREDVYNIEPNGGTLTSTAGTEWVFLNGNGKEIYAYAANESAKQTVVIPTPAEWQGAVERKSEEVAKGQKANAARQQRQQDFLRRINTGRQQAGVRPVQWSEDLARKARTTRNYFGGGFSLAYQYRNDDGPRSPAEVLDLWTSQQWEKAAAFFDPNCTAVGFWDDADGVGFEYAPR